MVVGPKGSVYLKEGVIIANRHIHLTPEYAEKLFILSGAENKNLVWFEHGAHSMLRITDTRLYDKAIGNFLAGLPLSGEKVSSANMI